MIVQEIQKQIENQYGHILTTSVIQFVKVICYPIQNHQYPVK